MKFRKIAVFFTILLAALMMASVTWAESVVSSGHTMLTQEEIFNYWTQERAESAMPYPMTRAVEEGCPVMNPAGTVPPQATGEPGLVPGTLPTGESPSGMKPLEQDEGDIESESSTEPEPMGYTYPPPFTRFRVIRKMYNKVPYRQIGKVYFTSGGLNYVCSGSAGVGNDHMVLTAGHCVSDGAGNWHYNWIFRPAWKDPVMPYGQFAFYNLVTFTAWHSNGDLCRDVAYALVGTSSTTGLSLQASVGTLGFAYNWDAEKIHWNMFGYPAAAPFNGKKMQESQASFAMWDPYQTCSPLPHAAGSDQTGGCSGGPWIRTFWPGQKGGVYYGNYANGVNSYKYTSPSWPDQMFSPYFDTAVDDMRVFAAGL